LDAVIDIPVDVVVKIISFFLERIGIQLGPNWPPEERKKNDTKI
jgi:hypothetical protein